MLINRFFVTNAKESPGRVYTVEEGLESVFYQRREGRIDSIAFSNTERLCFVNREENAIYAVINISRFSFTTRVHSHTTYIQDIAFDSDGNLYFSEASGARANGAIFRRTGGSTSTLFLEIELSEVGGFWAGDFAFDTQDNLYISSGDRIPASIYRFRDGTWNAVFTDKSEPITGLTFLACDLLCYANCRSEIYILDTNSGSRELLYSNPSHLCVSGVALLHPQIEEETLYEGTKVYSCNSTCWRDDGTVRDYGWGWESTDINANNADIAALLADIGAPTAPTTDDDEIWNRTRTVWEWLQEHTLGIEDPAFTEALQYKQSLDGYPTIADYAYMFTQYGGFAWRPYYDKEIEDTVHVCTCMCRAHILATLLYRVGIPSDRMAIAETRWKPVYSQHMYVVLKLGCHWYYVDPSDDIPQLSATPENAGSGARDYKHPNKLKVIPGSGIVKPMLVR